MAEYIVSRVKCDLCSNIWFAIYEHEELDKFECPQCENFSYVEFLEIEDLEENSNNKNNNQ